MDTIHKRRLLKRTLPRDTYIVILVLMSCAMREEFMRIVDFCVSVNFYYIQYLLCNDTLTVSYCCDVLRT